MNERLEQLAEQCRIEEYNQHGDLIEFGFDEEKFAELIVAECLVTLDSIVCDTSGERDTLWVARKVAADHFGVEE